MTLDPVKNFAKVTVSTGYDAAATSIVLVSEDGAKLPAPATDGAFNLVWWNDTDYKDPADDPSVEIVRCTARSTDTLTITRAQEETTATVKNLSGKTYKMVLSITKKTIIDLLPTEDFVASDNVKNSNDDQKTKSSATYVKVKEIKLNEDLPACRIYFGGKASAGAGDCYFRIYKNGVAIGTERQNNDMTYDYWSEDFTNFVIGDLIQIYTKSSTESPTYVQNFRFEYDRSILTIRGLTLSTPLTVTTAILVTNQDP